MNDRPSSRTPRHGFLARPALLVLAFVAGVGCAAPVPDLPVAIGFVARSGGEPFSCARPLALPGGVSLEPSHLKLFVHDVRLVDDTGAEVPVRLLEDGHWQHDGVAMLDLEDGSGACRNGTKVVHARIDGLAPAGTYRGLRFRVGVPFALNHANPAKAVPPLSDTSMHWDWQGGYKFLRLDGRIGLSSTPGDGRITARPLRVHLGSTGCEGTIGNISSCARPNRPEVRLDSFTLDRPEVYLELDRMLAGVIEAPGPDAGEDRGAGHRGAAGCMGGADEAGCAALFENLGLELATGKVRIATEVFKSP